MTPDERLILTPGLHYDVPADVYHADPCATPSLSASIAGTLTSQSPLHAWQQHPRLGGKNAVRTSTPAQDRGSILHELILGVGGGYQEIDAKDWRKAAAQEARDAARSAGLVPVLSADLAEYREIASIVHGRLAQEGIIFSGRSEVTAIWESMGVLCRGRMDHYIESEGIIYDPKSTTAAMMARLDLKMIDNGSDIQAVAYPEAIETLYPAMAGRVRMKFVFFETDPPYDVVVAESSGMLRERGSILWNRAKRQWAECLESNIWPGRSRSKTVRVDCSPWALDQAMQGE